MSLLVSKSGKQMKATDSNSNSNTNTTHNSAEAVSYNGMFTDYIDGLII